MSDRVESYFYYGLKKLGNKPNDKIVEMIKNMRVDGFFSDKNPISMAEGLVYFNCIMNWDDVSQKEISKIFGTTITNVGRAYRKLLEESNKN